MLIHQRRVNRDQFQCVLGGCWHPFDTRKWFRKYALGTRVFGIYRTPLGCYENLIKFDLSIHPSRSSENINIFSMHYHLLDPDGGVDTLAWKARGLKTPRDLADVRGSENLVWLLLLHLSYFVTWKLWKNASKSSCLYTIMAHKSMKDRQVLKTRFPEQRLIV